MSAAVSPGCRFRFTLQDEAQQLAEILWESPSIPRKSDQKWGCGVVSGPPGTEQAVNGGAQAHLGEERAPAVLVNVDTPMA